MLVNDDSLSKQILLLTFGAIVTMVSLIISGLFDPKPYGELKETIDPGTVQGELWLAEVPETFSVRMMIESAETEASLIIGQPDRHLAFVIASDQYTSIWRTVSAERSIEYPWQPRVHIKAAQNELWLDASPQRWTIRINREIFYDDVPLLEKGAWRVGLKGEDSAEFITVEIYH